MDIRTGAVRWEKPLHDVNNWSAAGGYLILIKEKGDLLIAEAKPGKYAEVSGRKRIIPRSCLAAPVLCGATLYIKNDKGEIISIDVSKNRRMGPRNYYYLFANTGNAVKQELLMFYGRILKIWIWLKNALGIRHDQ